jgi:hypothetical protein
MKKKTVFVSSMALFLLLAVIVGRCDLSPVWLGFSLFALCFLALLGFGWISVKKES